MAQQAKVVKARFRFKATMPLHLEYAIQNMYGFHYFSAKVNEWRMYEKFDGEGFPPVLIDYSDLPESTINDLTRQVNRIAGCFADQDAHKNVIKVRCTNMARTLGPRERQWVLDWIIRNVDENSEDDADEELPWSVENGPPEVKEH